MFNLKTFEEFIGPHSEWAVFGSLSHGGKLYVIPDKLVHKLVGQFFYCFSKSTSREFVFDDLGAHRLPTA